MNHSHAFIKIKDPQQLFQASLGLSGLDSLSKRDDEIRVALDLSNQAVSNQEIKTSKEIDEEIIQDVSKPKQKTFSEDVIEKVQQLKSIFEEARLEGLFEFVSQIPNLQIEELVESYLTY